MRRPAHPRPQARDDHPASLQLDRMTRRKWLRWVLAAFLAPVVLVLAVLLSSPLWINQDLVKREVTQLILNATGGKAQFDRIDLRLLPYPGVKVLGFRYSMPGKVEAQTQSVAANLRLWPLLLGKVYPHRVEVIAP